MRGYLPKGLRLPPFTMRILAAWTLSSAHIILLGLFVGVAYSIFFFAVLTLSWSLWATSEARWCSLSRFLWGEERSAKLGDKAWTLGLSFRLFVHGLIWLGLAVVSFMYANIRLVGL